jgi:hypothetical protein
MTIASLLNLLAWLLSAVIAAWLLYDMTRVSRQHDERRLLGLPDALDDVDSVPAGSQRKDDAG